MKKELVLFADEYQKDLADLPELDADECGKSWSFCSGGRGLRDQEWCITVYRGDATDIYPLPESINTIINTVRLWGKEEAQRAVKAALGL